MDGNQNPDSKGNENLVLWGFMKELASKEPAALSKIFDKLWNNDAGLPYILLYYIK